MDGRRPDWEEEELDGGVAAFLESEEAAWVPGEEAAGDGVLIPEWGNLAEDDGEIPGPSQWEAWRNDAPVTAGRGRREQLYMDDVLPVEPEQTGAASEPMTVWIIGHSFTYWGHRHACGHPYGPHLDLQRRGVRVIWLGRRGMLWDELVPYVRKERERRAAPRVLVVHLGGNDWDAASCCRSQKQTLDPSPSADVADILDVGDAPGPEASCAEGA
ncbi:uncharacterized protein LOC115096281 [Rhinatrema bivittatum]|uniref:uncharacterized protein LOC115096281 n=1 Tax=Rhinatrema bivittatum TaxID=194408 RepID=UPI0011273E96|nr:uncharacterized protein LOC115096281 [Rhinatrema bivittatum]